MLIRPNLSPADNRRIQAMLLGNQGGFVIPRAGLAAAFDAALGVTSSGGFASALADQSGNGRNLLQATGANQPIHLPFAGTKYAYLPAVASNYLSTPSAAANQITGDIAIVWYGSLDDWTTTFDTYFCAKYQLVGNNRAYAFGTETGSTGKLTFTWSNNGTAITTKTSSVATGIADGSNKYIAASFDVDNGAAGSDCKFWTSDDGVTWAQLGTTQTTAGVASIFASSAIVESGSLNGGGINNMGGKCRRMQIYNGIPPMFGGSGSASPVVDFDPSRWTSGTTFTASTGETWTINSTGSKPAQIVDRPSLLFDGAAHFMKCNAFTLNQPETVYIVAKQVSWTVNDTLLDGNASGSMSIYQRNVTPTLTAYAGTLGGPDNTSLIVGTQGVVCAVFNGANSVLKVNSLSDVTGNAGASNGGGLTIGANGTPAGFSNIQAYEALIYSVSHDAATRANIIRALMSKHGVT